MKPRFAIIGCGKVGIALAGQLAGAGYLPAGFASKTLTSALKAARTVQADQMVFDKTWIAAKQADIVFITTPDQCIAEVCRTIAQHDGFQKDAMVFHCSGALSSAVLSPARSCGACIGSMHPLQSFATLAPGNPFAKIMVAVEGDEKAVETAAQIASDLGAIPFTIKTAGKMLYHAAAVVASNYLVTVMELAFTLIAASGVERSDAFRILKPLIEGTLKNIETVGIPSALTGPIARGDVEIVEKHLEAMASLSPEVLSLYRRLGQATIEIARAKGTLSNKAGARLKKVLD